MTSPAVSVVVPCYNGGRFLPQLFASLDAQTFRDFETVLVDDGSTEPETLAALAALPEGVRLVRQENKGLPAARNTGMKAATGEFLLPLDCDDALAPSFLARAVESLRAAPPDVAFVFADMQLSGDRAGVLPRHFNMFDQLFLNQVPYCLLMRRSLWQALGGYDETMREGYEDWEFNIRLARHGGRGLELNEPLFRYFVSDKGMLMSMSARRHGRLWRRIRDAHPELYNLPTLLVLNRAWARAPRKVPLAAGLGLLALSKLLPDAAFGRLFHALLKARRRLDPPSGADGRRRAA